MFNFICNKEEYSNELLNVIKLFYPDLSVLSRDIIFRFSSNIVIEIFSKKFIFEIPKIHAENSIEFKRLELRFCKICLYKALKGATRRKVPWGSLTGIRPTKLFYELLADGNSIEVSKAKFRKVFLVSKKKTELVSRIVSAQKSSYFRDDNLVNLYVHIPFCPSRCSYCSFVSTTIDKQKDLLEPYCSCLTEEIEKTCDLIKNSNRKIFSVYVGGGTPTSLPDNLFKRVLTAIYKCLDKNVEFTVEAGRPETISVEKLEIMKNCGVTRISVNPQTLKNETLKLIGRNHTVEDFYNAYKIVDSYGFIINVDLIAGLENESLKDFKTTVKGVLNLFPKNVTVHTLSKKNGSILSERGGANHANTDSMLEFAHAVFKKRGYVPYYLYRQKQMVGNLENVGYAQPGYACVNNISTMEETLSVYACGAGAISKMIYGNGRIERLANVKDVKLYIDQFSERLIKKEYFYQKS